MFDDTTLQFYGDDRLKRMLMEHGYILSVIAPPETLKRGYSRLDPFDEMDPTEKGHVFQTPQSQLTLGLDGLA